MYYFACSSLGWRWVCCYPWRWNPQSLTALWKKKNQVCFKNSNLSWWLLGSLTFCNGLHVSQWTLSVFLVPPATAAPFAHCLRHSCCTAFVPLPLARMVASKLSTHYCSICFFLWSNCNWGIAMMKDSFLKCPEWLLPVLQKLWWWEHGKRPKNVGFSEWHSRRCCNILWVWFIFKR